MDGNITLLSLNCRGLNNEKKRSEVFKYLKEKECNIYCLQDVHFTEKIENDLRKKWEGKMFFASYKSNARGVCILFNNNFECEVTEKEKDKYGNYIIIDFVEPEHNQTFTLINIYGPNNDNPYFYDLINHYLTNSKNNVKIVCGDFNLVQDNRLDRKDCKEKKTKARSKVEDIKEKHDLVDPYRKKHPRKNGFTWELCSGSEKARLDFFLVSEKYLKKDYSVSVEKTKIKSGSNTKTISDHSAIILKFNL